MDVDTGQRIHRIIGALATGAPTRDDLFAQADALWRAEPATTGVQQRSVWLRCVTASAVYFARCRPSGDWHLTGVEVDLGGAIADLVWSASGAVVIDEIKSGSATIASPAIADQVRRLAIGGRARFGRRFVGVRLVPLAAPARLCTYDVVDCELVAVVSPPGMEVAW